MIFNKLDALLMRGLGMMALTASLLSAPGLAQSRPVAMSIHAVVDPLDRSVHVEYAVSRDAPDEVEVTCRYRLSDGADWQAAAVNKYRSATTEAILDEQGSKIRQQERSSGKVSEYLAAGRTRTLVWQTYPQLELKKYSGVGVEVTVADEKGVVLGRGQTKLDIDLSEEFVPSKSMILQTGPELLSDGKSAGWAWQKDKQLMLEAMGSVPLEPLAFDLKKRGITRSMCRFRRSQWVRFSCGSAAICFSSGLWTMTSGRRSGGWRSWMGRI
jgi:hypothetical protein